MRSGERGADVAVVTGPQAGLELRQRHRRRRVLEHHLHRHADADGIGSAADDVGEQAHALVELDVGEHVRQRVAEPRRLVLVRHGERVDRAAPFAPHPLDRARQARRAERPRDSAAARAAAARTAGSRARAAGRPPRSPSTPRRCRGRGLVYFGVSHFRSQKSSTAETAEARSRIRSMLGFLRRVSASSAVTRSSSFPQHHRHAAVAQAQHAARCRGTERDLARPPPGAAPHSPRSCFTASMTRKMPRMPGWLDERPPPSVLIGSAPPRPRRPPVTKAPPSPLAQKPRFSRRQQHGDRERVVDHAQVDVGVLDAGHRHGARARLLRRHVGEIAHARSPVWQQRLAAAEDAHRRASARSRARAAPVTTSAPPPSEMMQQSSRCSGDETTRDASTSATVIGSRYFACRVELGVPPHGDGDLGELLGRWCRTRACGAARRARRS